MRAFLGFVLLCSASAAFAQRPLSLVPFEAPVDFTPARPSTVSSEHPLFRRIAVGEIEGLTGRVGSALNPVSHAREINAALRSTLAGANMLAADGQAPRARLRVVWQQFALPFRIGLSSRATVTVRYELSRIDNGQVIFARDISTEVRSRGGDGATRARTTGRAAILANMASLAYCLERAAVAPAPADCALQPVGRFSAPITVVTPIYRR